MSRDRISFGIAAMAAVMIGGPAYSAGSSNQLSIADQWQVLDCYKDMTWDASGCRKAGVTKRGEFFYGPLGSNDSSDPAFNPELNELMIDCRGQSNDYCGDDDQFGAIISPEDAARYQQRSTIAMPSKPEAVSSGDGEDVMVCPYNRMDAAGLGIWRAAIPQNRRVQNELASQTQVRVSFQPYNGTIIFNGTAVRPDVTGDRPGQRPSYLLDVKSFFKAANDTRGTALLAGHQRTEATGMLNELNSALGRDTKGMTRVVVVLDKKLVFGHMRLGADNLANQYIVDCW